MSKAFVGIDVAKEYSTAQGIDSNEKKIFYLRFAMDLPVVIIPTSFPSYVWRDFVVSL